MTLLSFNGMLKQISQVSFSYKYRSLAEKYGVEISLYLLLLNSDEL